MIPTAEQPTFAEIDLRSARPGLGVAAPDPAAFLGGEFEALLRTLPEGRQSFWGVPFFLQSDSASDRWIWLGEGAPTHTIPLGATADYIVVAHFCLPARASAAEVEGAPTPSGKVITPGEHLATYVIQFDDGSSASVPIRRRFEVNDAYLDYGHPAFAARPHRSPAMLDWRGPHGDQEWGRNQQSVEGSPYGRWQGWRANYWIHAVPNPAPDRAIAALELHGHAGWTAVAGITLFRGNDHPLRHGRLETVRITAGDGLPAVPEEITVDLGLLGHRRTRVPADQEAWLAADVRGWGEAPVSPRSDEILVELTASEAATLRVGDRSVGVGHLLATGAASSDDGAVRVEVLPAAREWVHVTVRDSDTGRPTPARVHLRSGDGRYLPPYGHRHEVNDRWFEDYGADVLLGSTPYAYVDGEFDVELPAGDVLVEIVKGFDYEPLRQVVEIGAGSEALAFEIRRAHDRRREGWITADTHVHFLSPQTASLEAAAEDINVINLLATQWGDLYTNVGDYTGRASATTHDDTIVWVGTENRQHFLGHMNLLGTHGDVVGRMCAGGPPESYLGDPVHTTLAEWADRGHRESGLVVIPHFPAPYSEVVADVALGKIDGVEVRDFDQGIDSFAVREWYRLLNVGFRVAVVGGTDKMSAGMPVGGVRTYTRTANEPVSFERWADGVRAGRTVTSTGPFIDLRVDGAEIGDELRVAGNGGTVTVEAVASGFQPLGRLEIVYNGRVVAAAHPTGDRYRIELSETIRVTSDGWIAARCDGPDTLWHSWTMRPAAHTSPVYLVGAGERVDAGDLVFLQTIVEGGLTWMDTLATPVDRPTHERLRRTFLDAREVLARLDRSPR